MELTNREKVMAVALIATILIAGALLLMASYRIKTTGRIKAIDVDVFKDSTCTILVESINWGTMQAGDLAGESVYIKNIKNTNFTLSFNTTDWDPVNASDYLIFDWNYSGIMLEPGDVIPVQMTLYADPNIVGITDFSFDIYIIATEVE